MDPGADSAVRTRPEERPPSRVATGDRDDTPLLDVGQVQDDAEPADDIDPGTSPPTSEPKASPSSAGSGYRTNASKPLRPRPSRARRTSPLGARRPPAIESQRCLGSGSG